MDVSESREVIVISAIEQEQEAEAVDSGSESEGSKSSASSDESEPEEKAAYPTAAEKELDPSRLENSYITEDQIKSTFANFINTNTYCCSRPKDAKSEATVLSASSKTILRFRLSSYVESRSFVHRIEKLNRNRNAPIQPDQGTDLWIYDARPVSDWWNGKREVLTQKIVKDCPRCVRGRKGRCHMCHGSGKRNDKRCYRCHGKGWISCRKCAGIGQLSHNRYLVAKFRTVDGFHLEGGEVGVPRAELEQTQGTDIYYEEAPPPIAPIPHYPYSETVNDAALKLLELHYNLYMIKYSSSKRLWKQRETLSTVPVTDVSLSFRGREYDTWIYGINKEVYCPDMDTCCMWCCFCCGCMHGKRD
ncbi:protein SSUH2 homolog isoform X1 [Convolutriloba macropyga]|uniref:protein SSUH2 homolog isoform X1 n=1 Tax=Convolutriloba macropyga TaxID=536237 RepID=UPI003F51E4BA